MESCTYLLTRCRLVLFFSYTARRALAMFILATVAACTSPLTPTLPHASITPVSPTPFVPPITILAVTPTPAYSPTPTPTTHRYPSLTPSPSPTKSPTRTPTPSSVPTATHTPTTTPSPSPSPPPYTSEVAYWEDIVSIPTYPFARFLRDAVDTRLGNFPYKRFNRAAYEGSQPLPTPVAYRRLHLRNRYLHLTLLPDLGGRLYEFTFRPSGNNELYHNPVVKPTRWGPTDPPGADWWLAVGGIEWGFPVDEHGYEFGIPWEYTVMPEAAGYTVTLFDGHPSLPNVSVDVTLFENRADIALTFRVSNPTSLSVRVKFWHNAMVAPGPSNSLSPGFHFLFPGRQALVHSTSDPELPGPYDPFSWPFYKGRDLRYPGNWLGWLGFFIAPAAQANWSAVYDKIADEGLVRIFPREVMPGLKGFAFDNGIPPSEWTDDNSTYAEMHGGLAPTFRDWREIPPGGIIEWMETWFPVWRIGGVVHASVEGALNLERSEGHLQVGYFPTHPVQGILVLLVDGREVWAQEVVASPGAPARADISLPNVRAATAEVVLEFRTPAGEPIISTKREMDLR